MTVTTTRSLRSVEGCASGRRSFESFLLDGEDHIVAGAPSRAFGAFLGAVPADLQPMIVGYFRSRPSRRDLPSWQPPAVIEGRPVPAESIGRESRSIQPGRVGAIDLLLEELTIDPVPARRAEHSHDSVFIDVTTVDAEGAVATTGNRVCLRRRCLPAAFCDRVLATIRIDQLNDSWPRTISFEIDAFEGANDRLPEMIAAAGEYLHHDISGILADRDGYRVEGGIMPEDVAGRVDSHVRGWLDCFTVWCAEVLRRSHRKEDEVVLGGAQFTATLNGPALDYAYRNSHTGRQVQITGPSLVRTRPMVHTFVTAGEELRARFRLGLRDSAALNEPSFATIRSRVLETVDLEAQR